MISGTPDFGVWYVIALLICLITLALVRFGIGETNFDGSQTQASLVASSY